MKVLLVSRPVAPAVYDGTVGLVRTLATAGATAGWRCAVLVPAGTAPPPGVEGRLAALPTFLPTRLGEAAWRPLSLLSLATAPARGIRHYFFTPTPQVVIHLRRLHRLRPGPTVQTLCSTPPDHIALAPLLFADRVVALSEHTRQRLLDEGIGPERVAYIPPAVEAPPGWDRPGGRGRQRHRERVRQRVRHRLGLSAQTPLVLYLGDYDGAGTAQAVAEALPEVLSSTDAHAVLACRPKGANHRAVAAEVLGRLSALRADLGARVHLLSTISWSAELAAGADVALFPAQRLPDKMDLPLALLESMAAGVPAVVADSGPLGTLVRAGAAVGVDTKEPDRLATQVIGLLADPARYDAAATAAQRWWAAEANPRILMERHGELYQALLTTKTP